MDTQTIYKDWSEYYKIHSAILLKKGYKIIKDTTEFTVFEEQSKGTGEDSKDVQNVMQPDRL